MDSLHSVLIAVEHPFHSGTFAEVSTCEIQDYGGNVLWSGTAKEYLGRERHRTKHLQGRPTKLVAKSLGEIRIGAYSEVVADFYAGE